MNHTRLLPLLGGLAALSALGFAYVLQYAFGLEPCPMCIFQRVAMLAAGVVFLLWAAYGPAGWGRWLMAGLSTLAAGIGAFIAGRHVWLQSLPEDQIPACGPTLDYLMDIMPAWEVIQTIMRGDGNCAKIDASFLGLSIPAWTLVGFAALMLWAIMAAIATRPPTTDIER